MSRIVLFFPKYESDSVNLLPMSLLSIAAPLVKDGYSVRIIDQRIEKEWRSIVLNEIKEKPLVFGVSALTGQQILNGLEVSKLVKENSDIPIVWGGVHVSLLPHQTLESEFIDFVVVGEGEETFKELVEALKHNNGFENIKGLGYKKEKKIIINHLREFIDLGGSAETPYNLVNVEKYISQKSFATGKLARNIAFYTSRGCPHRCGFCYNQEFNQRKWRGKSAERVVSEMKYLIDNYKINSFEIEDDEFFVDIGRARKICELIIKENLNIEIFTSCRVNYVVNMDDKYLNLLYRAGFKTLSFGVESGSERILDLMHKDITIDQVFETIKRLKKAGINSKYYFMAGFPTEKVDDLYKTTDLICKMKKMDPQIRIPAWRVFTPYPGTGLYDLAVKEGWQPPKKINEWANYDFNTINMPWINGKTKKIIENVAFLVNYLEQDKAMGRGFFFRLVQLFSKLVGWRWEKHQFSFVPEKYPVNLILKTKNLFCG
ncbi:MAG: radical SAM protein [Nanoarchaeota archaeon]|nr:radical SAM protein [Nanoarchaeota archaeon]